MTAPQLLTRRQLGGLLKLGDILIPGDAELPCFSACGCAEQADRMLAHLNESDLKGLQAVLGIFGILPRPLVRGLYWITEQHQRVPDAMAGLLRLANIGIKGAVMTLYYSDVGDRAAIHELIRWDPKIIEVQREGD